MAFHRDESLERDLGRILRVVCLQTEALAGMRFSDECLPDAEILAYKVLQHATSTLVLYRGTSLDDFGSTRIWRDLFSVLGLARMCHESYVLFHHVFVEEVSEEEREFRVLAWRYVDFRKQARFQIYFEKSRELKEECKRLAGELILKLEENPVYDALSKGEKERIRKRLHWPLVSWAALARKAGFNEQHASQVYSYLCSYSHPGSLAIRQARLAAEQSFMGEIAEMGLRHVAIILASLARDFPTVFPASRPVLEVDKAGSQLVELYVSFARYKPEDLGLKLVD